MRIETADGGPPGGCRETPEAKGGTGGRTGRRSGLPAGLHSNPWRVPVRVQTSWRSDMRGPLMRRNAIAKRGRPGRADVPLADLSTPPTARAQPILPVRDVAVT
ncbi:hypothetical protein SGFS_003520 [Streptomyces graminofaciens]|uniref:Uncharacterized protein n=1 Tax=Streptomyces graminofaciens TaxID=68212 RepID=A0ABM7F0C8_9ACTN|nr:hypothetical protein SGFS_003520 [Streptomyces graminofaciens]